jgi:hypothetical protein
MNGVPWSALLVLAALSATPQAPRSPDILPAPSEGFTFEGRAGAKPSLMEFLEQYQRVAGVHLIISPRAQVELAGLGTGLKQSIELPPEKVNELMERVLAEAGYCTTLLHTGTQVLIVVKKVPRAPLRAGAVFVAVDELASVENHPALLCWTVVHVPLVSAHSLDVALAKKWRESESNAYAQLGGSGCRLLIGTGKTVASHARELLDLEEAERTKTEAALKPDGGSSK